MESHSKHELVCIMKEKVAYHPIQSAASLSFRAGGAGDLSREYNLRGPLAPFLTFTDSRLLQSV
jgi:hypothetical protein